MRASRLARYVFLAALVFSQSLYAGHTLLHADGVQADCQICQHSSPMGAALHGTEAGVSFDAEAVQVETGYAPPALSAQCTSVHPARAPPTLL
jgi:hypothetical protein